MSKINKKQRLVKNVYKAIKKLRVADITPTHQHKFYKALKKFSN